MTTKTLTINHLACELAFQEKWQGEFSCGMTPKVALDVIRGLSSYVFAGLGALEADSPVWLWASDVDGDIEEHGTLSDLKKMVAGLKKADRKGKNIWVIVAGDGWESPVVDLALVSDPDGNLGLLVVYDDLQGSYPE